MTRCPCRAVAATAPACCVEALLGGFGALLVLAFVFASFLAIVPILMAIVSIMTTFLLVWGLTTVTEVSPIVQFLIALIGLGVSIDYSLLVVVRWREERAHGREGDEAIQRAMETAGRAVVFSGTTVAIGLLALDRAAAAVPALRRLWRHADPADQRDRRDLTLLPVVLSPSSGRASTGRMCASDDNASTALGPAGRSSSCAGAGSPRSAPRSCSRRS